METNSIIAFIACLFFLFILGKIFIVPLKMIMKLILNSLLGALMIFVMNIVGRFFGFHIGINLVTTIFVGVLGIPGAVVVVFIKLLLG